MLGSRLRGTAGPKVQCWTLTGNGYNDAWEILEQRQDSMDEPLGLSIELVRASTLDNPYLDDGDIKRFERQFADTDRAEQALHGGFAAAQGLVYSSFRREDHVIPHSEALNRVEDDWRIYGYDAGWDDSRVLLELGRTDHGQLVVLDEFHRTASHIEDAIRWLQTKPRGYVFAEHEPANIKKFRQANSRAVRAAKSVDLRIADVRHRLERDTEERVGLLVADRCEHLSREFLGYKTEHVGVSSADDHCLDALRYAIHTAREREIGPCSNGPAGGTSTAGAQSEVDTAGSERARRRDRHRGRFRSAGQRR